MNTRMLPATFAHVRTLLLSVLCVLWMTRLLAVAEHPPVFEVDKASVVGPRLSELFHHHYREPTVKGAATLWDMWLVNASLWYAGDSDDEGSQMRSYWRNGLLTRPIDAEGYVGTCQHLGSAHSDGWPFPLWTQSEGIGWHFTLAHNPFLAGQNTPITKSLEGWTLRGCSVVSVDEGKGCVLRLDEPNASLTTPTFDVDSYVSPFVCLDHSAEGFADGDSPTFAWRTNETFDEAARVHFAPLKAAEGAKLMMIPLYEHPKYQGRFKQWRIEWNNSGPMTVTLRAIHTAVDSRHNINNSSYVLGTLDYARWTGDLNFVRDSLPRVWKALDYALDEFHVRETGVVHTRWVGHDGRTGLSRPAPGQKKLIRGRGIGSNYWDLLPFGSRDLMATLYLLAAIDRTADLHRQIERHPEWNLPLPPARLMAEELERLAARMRSSARALFWNDTTGRFAACVDEDRFLHDYGFTFLNTEATLYGLATDAQARSIYTWLDGKRSVLGDTSQGTDIYHFRFAPRATTKRNVDWYMFAWSDPESIPWGGQVQDGGAVLSWSYHDVMSRLRFLGKDDAWKRIEAIAQWYDEVQKEGGYRAYYGKPGRGTLQGCGTPGGLGIDCEFSESLLVPLTLIEGFAGLTPTLEGMRIDPKLPSGVDRLTVRQVFFHGQTFNVEVLPSEIVVRSVAPAVRPTRWKVARSSTPLSMNNPEEAWTVWDGRTPAELRFSRDTSR